MNLLTAFIEGQKGKNLGLPTGIANLDKAMGGVQRRSIYGIAAAPKVGKTTFADLSFVIEPYLFVKEFLEQNPNSKLSLKIFYYSFEIDRIRKEFKYAAHFFFRDYGITSFIHNGVEYPMSPRYLEGKLRDANNELIKVSPEHIRILGDIYEKRIVPMFGRYDDNGKKIENGVIEFIEQKDNPTGLRNNLLSYAEQHGKFVYEHYSIMENGVKVNKSRIIGYKADNPEEYVITVTDHLRKLKRERNFSLKENMDKWIEYSVELRNWCSYTFAHIVHLNRALSVVDRIKYFKDKLYPTGDDVKDSGNLSEECDFLLTMFNPKDEKYNINKHFDVDITNIENYRSIHLVESRDTDCPQHLQLEMMGGINYFQPINRQLYAATE